MPAYIWKRKGAQETAVLNVIVNLGFIFLVLALLRLGVI